MAIKVNGTTVIDDSRNLVNIASGAGGMTLLGTVSTSGSSVTLSGLDLSGYKAVYMVISGVSLSGSYSGISLIGSGNSNSIASIGASDSAKGIYADVTLDLATGMATSSVSHIRVLADGSDWDSNSRYAGGCPTSYSTSSTSITFYATSYNFSTGSIRLYGVA